MARQFNIKVFDGVIMGSAASYTLPDYNQPLGTGDRIVIQALADQVTGTSPTITVQVEHGGDQRNWVNKNGTAEINAASLSATAVTSAVGYEPGTNPSLGYVRLRIQLGGTGSLAARVIVHATGRTN